MASGSAAASDGPFAKSLCQSLASAVDASAPAGRPGFVVSYRPGPRESDVPQALRSSAFVYDNALAAVALVACGETERAKQIGDALLRAAATDRTFQDGRIRNAYRTGPLPDGGKALLPGWWDADAGLWAEDAYQDGTSTGNVAWAALALLNLHQVTQDRRYLAGAGSLMRWIDENARDAGKIGFTGGRDGFDQAQAKLTWASTEHNVDIAAAAEWLSRVAPNPALAGMAHSARRFVKRAFLHGEGCFVLGTTPEGVGADHTHLALDTQLWPLLLTDAPAAWRPALTCAEQRLGVQGGFDFDNDKDGLWVEGTGQAALLYRVLGDHDRSERLLHGLQQDQSPSGWLFATRGERLTTGLKIGPHSTVPDFFYFRRPHLGATAWAVLAATGWNPFTGRKTS
ncbi:hypothetical protein [uncultured Enterovirga sp.]|uniref:hypothetical protein n=1 Tax=uncultured Enterovirga sp. TaxID=2026352 RepID=UPI0035CB0321